MLNWSIRRDVASRLLDVTEDAGARGGGPVLAKVV